MPEGQPQPLRLFLDTGVIMEGSVSEFSASRALLILASQHRQRYKIVLAAEVEQDELPEALGNKVRTVTEALERKGASDAAVRAESIKKSAAIWLTRIQLERPPVVPRNMCNG